MHIGWFGSGLVSDAEEEENVPLKFPVVNPTLPADDENHRILGLQTQPASNNLAAQYRHKHRDLSRALHIIGKYAPAPDAFAEFLESKLVRNRFGDGHLQTYMPKQHRQHFENTKVLMARMKNHARSGYRALAYRKKYQSEAYIVK